MNNFKLFLLIGNYINFYVKIIFNIKINFVF